MKYLLLVLILLSSSLPDHAIALPAPPLRVYASASFSVSESAGTTTEVAINVNDSFDPAQLSISISRTSRLCAGDTCRDIYLVAAYGSQPVAPGITFIDRGLRYGFVHGRIPVHDTTTNANLVLRVDIAWSAVGQPTCVALDDGEACQRTAAVAGDVASDAETFIAGQTAPDGQLIWRRPTY